MIQRLMKKTAINFRIDRTTQDLRKPEINRSNTKRRFTRMLMKKDLQSHSPDSSDEYCDENDHTQTGSDSHVHGDGKDNDERENHAPLQPVFEESIPRFSTPETLDPRSPTNFTDGEDEGESNAPTGDSSTEQRQYRHRLALIFAHDNYAPLHNLHSCCKDTRDMRGMLTSLGFDCTVLLNGKKRGMMSRERSFCDKLRQGDCVLVYFSGHSMVDKVRGNESSLCHYCQRSFFNWLFQGINYLVPIYRPRVRLRLYRRHAQTTEREKGYHPHHHPRCRSSGRKH